jgi:hypothetical protein
MVRLARAILAHVVAEYGPEEVLRRLSDPFWFQAFGCVLGFDWHSSGVTTTVCGALKEANKRLGHDLGIIVCGGKGVVSRRTPDEIRRACDKTGDPAESLIYASKTVAKVDSAAVQDDYQLYHHCFVFTPGQPFWCVIQQGMDAKVRYARRYHWLSARMRSFVSDPHAAIACDRRGKVLNLVASEADQHRNALTALSREHPERVLREVRPYLEKQRLPLFDGPAARRNGSAATAELVMPAKHKLSVKGLSPAAIKKVLLQTYERQAPEFELLLGEPGIGAEALRSLSLLAELIYHAPASRRDPASYSFAHGGKDGFPYPVNRHLYDENIERLRRAVEAAKIGQSEKVQGLKALAKFMAKAG